MLESCSNSPAEAGIMTEGALCALAEVIQILFVWIWPCFRELLIFSTYIYLLLYIILIFRESVLKG